MSTRRRNRERIDGTVDPEALDRARRYAGSTGQAVSGRVSRFMAGLPDVDDGVFDELDPDLRRFHGVLGGRGTLADREAHLVGKHLGESSGGGRCAHPGSGEALEDALASEVRDFDDAVQVAVARASGCTRVVTRDLEGFRGHGIPVSTPAGLAGEPGWQGGRAGRGTDPRGVCCPARGCVEGEPEAPIARKIQLSTWRGRSRSDFGPEFENFSALGGHFRVES